MLVEAGACNPRRDLDEVVPESSLCPRGAQRIEGLWELIPHDFCQALLEPARHLLFRGETRLHQLDLIDHHLEAIVQILRLCTVSRGQTGLELEGLKVGRRLNPLDRHRVIEQIHEVCRGMLTRGQLELLRPVAAGDDELRDQDDGQDGWADELLTQDCPPAP